MSVAYIALGSNLGDKEANLKQALQLLQEQGLNVKAVSGFLKTAPYGVTDQPEFVNGGRLRGNRLSAGATFRAAA